MCLKKITKVYKPSLFNLWMPKFAYKSGAGWKLFDRVDGKYVFSWIIETANEKLKLPIGVFINEKDFRPSHARNKKLGDSNIKYNYGWHIFEEKIELWPDDICMRVEYEGAHTFGTNRWGNLDCNTIVAKYMKILEE